MSISAAALVSVDWWFRFSGLPLCSKLESTLLRSGAILGRVLQGAGCRVVFFVLLLKLNLANVKSSTAEDRGSKLPAGLVIASSTICLQQYYHN